MTCRRVGCDSTQDVYSNDLYGDICADCRLELMCVNGEMTITDFMHEEKKVKRWNQEWADYIASVFKGSWE